MCSIKKGVRVGGVGKESLEELSRPAPIYFRVVVGNRATRAREMSSPRTID